MATKPLTERELLARLHLVLFNHLADLKQATGQLERGVRTIAAHGAAAAAETKHLKRGVRTLDSTTSYLGRALLSIAERQGMHRGTIAKLRRQMKGGARGKV
jgi:hypothetical protein